MNPRHSIRRKLTLLLSLGSAIVLLLGMSAFCVIEVLSFRDAMADKYRALATLLGKTARPALELQKSYLVERHMRSLVVEEDVVYAVIFDERGRPSARYLRSGTTTTAGMEHPFALCDEVLGAARQGNRALCFTWGHLALYEPLLYQGELFGGIFLQTSLASLYARLYNVAPVPVLILLVLLIVSYLISRSLQKRVTTPLVGLAQTMDAVSLSGDFSARAAVTSQDEIGMLARGFNGMLEQLEKRDRELEQYRDHLEEQVALQTSALTRANQELQQTVAEREAARAAAEKASQAKSSFLANLSHEIRTPMTGLLGMAEILRERPLGPQELSLVENIQNSGQGLLSLLNEILEFSRIESGKLEIRKVPFNLLRTVEEAAGLLGAAANAKNLELVIDLDPRLAGTLCGDPLRIRQIVHNLVGNAIKFTSEGEVCLRLEVRGETERSLSVVIEVSDTGIGIAPELQERIFESFTQAHPGITRRYGGTGLGLSIVQELVRHMSGSIALRSAPAEGSVFTVLLPFERERSGEEQGTASGTLAGVRVGLAVGNSSLRSALARTLEGAGVSVRHHLDELAGGGSGPLAPLTIVVGEESGTGLPAGLPAVLLTNPLHTLQTEAAEGRGAPVMLVNKPVLPTRLLSALEVVSRTHQESRRTQLERGVKARVASGEVRILVAEDDPTIQQLLRIHLHNRGLGCEVVSTGQEAVDLIRTNRFHLVFMDCNMPLMDGLEATRLIRAEGYLLPVIGLSAHADGEQTRRFLEHGLNDYLRKPFQRQQIYAALDRWLPAVSRNLD